MNQDRIQSLQVGIKIIDLLLNHNRPLKFNEIHAQTSMAKSNLYKYLNTLTDLGLLYREKQNGTYMLGSKLIEYGMAAADRENVLERINPFLLEISRTSNETTLLVVWTSQGPMITNMINGNKSINIGAKLGSYLPVQSASGKIFSAFMDQYEIKDWQEAALQDMSTEEQKAYEKELERVKKEGISFAREALVPSVYSVSLPVLNYRSDLMAAVTLVGFKEDIPTKIDDPLSEYLLRINSEISAAFGYENNRTNE